MAEKPSLQDISDKLDKLLRHQRNQRIWGWAKSIFWLIIFAVFFGGPAYYLNDIYKNPRKYFDPSRFQQYQKQIEQMMKQFQK